MSLNKDAIRSAMDHEKELEKYGISSSDFFSVLNYDNIIMTLNKLEKMEKNMADLKTKNQNLHSEIIYLRNLISK